MYGEDFVDMKWLSISIADKMVVESYSRSLRLIDAVVSWKCGRRVYTATGNYALMAQLKALVCRHETSE